MDSSCGVIGIILCQAAFRLETYYERRSPPMNHSTIAVDLAKSVFEIAVSNHPGHVSEFHRGPEITHLHSQRPKIRLQSEPQRYEKTTCRRSPDTELDRVPH
jgi:hypothetical protein